MQLKLFIHTHNRGYKVNNSSYFAIEIHKLKFVERLNLTCKEN